MSTICLFGATGKTGKILLNKLIAKGYSVQVLARNPAKVTISSHLVTVVSGDILDEQSVFKVLEKANVVINVIGHVKGCPPDLQTAASRNIINGMKKFGITRLIDLTGGGVKVKGDNPGWFDRLAVYGMNNFAGQSIKNRLIDGVNHVKLISKTNLEWTIVRAPVLLPGSAKKKTRVGFVGHIPGYTLTYEDLTDQIIKIMEEKTYIGQYPYITNG